MLREVAAIGERDLPGKVTVKRAEGQRWFAEKRGRLGWCSKRLQRPYWPVASSSAQYPATFGRRKIALQKELSLTAKSSAIWVTLFTLKAK